MGNAPQRVPSGWETSSPDRARRFEPRAARGGTPGLATPGTCARARIEQFARADQINRWKPGKPDGARRARVRLGRRFATRLVNHLLARRSSEPVHVRLRE